MIRRTHDAEEGLCSNCSGSGEGRADGTVCRVCRGSGAAQIEDDGPDPDTERELRDERREDELADKVQQEAGQ